MWCTRCHADVAGELAENGQALNCASCGHEIQKIYTPSLHPEIRSARELLERWSREERISPPPPAADLPSTVAASAGEKEPTAASFSAELKKHLPDGVAESPRKPADLISTNLKSSSDAPSVSETKASAGLATNAAPENPAAGKAVAEESGEQKPRKLLDRPAMARTAKPKTIWRADSPHGSAEAAEDAPKTVAPLQSIDTLVPPPLPVRPPRALQPSPSLTASPDAAPPAFPSKRSGARSSGGVPSAASPSGPAAPPAPVPETRKAAASRRRFDPAESETARPHFDLQTYLEQHPQKAGRSETLWGQLVAYAGVAVLTIGTTMILWGYFGGLGKYTSTGFLISTAGQMLLFLGVVTLVSGGMQQTSQDVSTRVEYLGDRMIRMEQATQQVLRSPHFARRRNRRAAARAAAERTGSEEGASDAA